MFDFKMSGRSSDEEIRGLLKLNNFFREDTLTTQDTQFFPDIQMFDHFL